MNDPKHLTDEGADATDFERELLLAAQEVRLSAAEKQAIWAGVALQALPGASVGPAAPSGVAAKTGVSLAPWIKGLLVICGLGGISVGIFGLRHSGVGASHSPEASSVELVRAPAPSAATQEAAPSAAPSDSPAVTANGASGASAASSAPSANRDPSPVESKSALREESLAVLEIRRTLRAGDASGALRLLEQARQRFPHGALSQEREALGIQALAQSGARDRAARQADAFLHAHPKSPYAADVQSFKSN